MDGLEVDIDGRTAAVIAAGMKAVALADGVSHPREMALIEQFCESLPEDADPSGVVLEDDRERELFVGTWVDNMSSAFASMEGQYLEDDETLRMRWQAPDWMTGELVDHWSDSVQTAHEQRSTFYRGDEDGEHQKVMEIVMTRVGAR